MLKFFQSKKKEKEEAVSNIQEDLFSWKYLDVSDLDQYSDAIKDIFDKKYDGIIIREIFSEGEISSMKNAIERMDREKMVSTGVGHSYPRLFAQLVRPNDGFSNSRESIKSYFEDCEQWPMELESLIGFDFKKRLEDVFMKLSGGRKIDTPLGFDGEGRYPNSSIRMNHPRQGFIMTHCGNYFQQEFPEFYEHLETEVNVKDQLSYFVTVNPAEIGGELTLFDLIWEPGQTKTTARHDNPVFLADGSELDVSENSNLKRQKVKPGPGDLLIFSGGPIWHKVELVEGSEERITIGGFLSFTNDMSTIKYWT